MSRPNILFIMTDQQRFDTIAALGNDRIYTPNMDRLVRRGVAFTNAYSTCPVCVPARYTIRTGCEPPTTTYFLNGLPHRQPGQPEEMEGRCGPYLARTLRHQGYRTFGIGKSHTLPFSEDIGFDVHLHSEEMWMTREERVCEDAYAAFITREHPEYAHIEQLMGERTEMYYMPQMSPLPAELGVESWAADRAIEQLTEDDVRPYFGFVSFVGPHPPCAPPVPFNRLYNPDRMSNPVCGDLELDHMDEQLPWMNHLIWAEEINASHTRTVKARYYGEITYIDQCLGRILDAVEARPDAENTLICFFADHGDHLGDHHAWQKESFFEAACHVPFLVSWPQRLPQDVRCDALACLTDLFGIATTAAGVQELRDGHDQLGVLQGTVPARERVIGYHGVPGTARCKLMVREGDWKYIYFANGGREQLFNVKDDPHELVQCRDRAPEITAHLRTVAIEALREQHCSAALDGDTLRAFPITVRPLTRIHQFALDLGVRDFPDHPTEVLSSYARPDATMI